MSFVEILTNIGQSGQEIPALETLCAIILDAIEADSVNGEVVNTVTSIINNTTGKLVELRNNLAKSVGKTSENYGKPYVEILAFAKEMECEVPDIDVLCACMLDMGEADIEGKIEPTLNKLFELKKESSAE